MQKYSTKTFIEKANQIHNNKFDYSLVNYLSSKIKVSIICPIHGLFEQNPTKHLIGFGCIKCSPSKTNQRSNSSDFISKAILKHNNYYDYSLVDYRTNKHKVKISCPKHGIFEQIPSHHLNGSGCIKCVNNCLSFSDFINRSRDVHDEYYDYSLVTFINTYSKVKILCPIHGEFEQKPSHHYNGAGCPNCNQSKGERYITKYLNENNIKFISQKRFKECRDKKPLPFDFYLPDFNICIEYDGKQHFVEIGEWGGVEGLLDRQRKDNIKTEYCLNNNIKLIRIKDNEKLNFMNN
jgi:very-short-patch-repair endonuclease